MRFPVTLRAQLLILQALIITVVVLITGVTATVIQSQAIREAHKVRMVGVASSIANLPAVTDAFGTAHPEQAIQPIAELIRSASDVTYVVVTDAEGIRYSHPNPERIGERVSTDPSIPLSGERFVGTEEGTLGVSWRVKVPIYDGDRIIGTTSVGVLETELREDLYDSMPALLAWLIGAGLVGTVGAYITSQLIWRRIHHQEPEQIAALLTQRDALLHNIGEGLIAVDTHGTVTLVNDEAIRLLELDEQVLGQPARQVLAEQVCRLLDAGNTAEGLILVGERVLLAKASDGIVDGRRIGSILVLRDRTELRRILRDLSGAKDLTEALRAQAHEFSNRLHVLSGMLHLGQVDAAKQQLQRFTASTSHGTETLPSLVAHPGVQALLLAKGAICREQDITLVMDIQLISPLGGALADDVVTVLGNLLDNAMESTGFHGRIEVLISQDHTQLHLEVHDDGPGFAGQIAARATQLGVSTKTADGKQARGIGLALVTRIVQRHGGALDISTSELGGAAVSVDLPHPQATQGKDEAQ
ncbi:sensor histidine kinase [Glutamicibacter sp. MNS18]|uniref:ATP-binding protein n=1 Tax=Glutamicibacter sp. MNS18 TaxID=2989817 RepID=UPI0022356D3F|nr:sensor histidine kinase [Glutamicibacter sp. MNS18]MCW4465234.1 sensor histidine kinase [Glutamicibacter sp. MNS18]